MTTGPSAPRRLIGLAGSQVTTADLSRGIIPVGHLIEQSLALALFRIVGCVPAIVCSAARAANCCERDQ
jgi:hypothetical protein